jgi:pyrimidine-nucleoside phosphorylase
VVEAIDPLHGHGPADFLEHCLHVSAHMLMLGNHAADLETGRRMAEGVIASGSAFEKFRIMVQAQGGDVSYADDPGKFPKATYIEDVMADRSGSLSQMNARIIGETSVSLGAGRAVKSDPVDHAVGLIIHHKVGEKIKKGEKLFTIHANDASRLAAARENMKTAFGWSNEPVASLPLFYE